MNPVQKLLESKLNSSNPIHKVSKVLINLHNKSLVGLLKAEQKRLPEKDFYYYYQGVEGDLIELAEIVSKDFKKSIEFLEFLLSSKALLEYLDFNYHNYLILRDNNLINLLIDLIIFFEEIFKKFIKSIKSIRS